MQIDGVSRMRRYPRPIDAIAASQPVASVAEPTAVADAIATGQWYPNPNSTGEYLPAMAGGISFRELFFLALVLIVAWWSWQHGYLTAAVHAVERTVSDVVSEVAD